MANFAHLAIYTGALLLSNSAQNFKISNLIGRAWISGAGTTHCMHSHQTDPFSLEIEGCDLRDYPLTTML